MDLQQAPTKVGDEARRRPAFETRWRERFRGFAESRDDDAGIAGWSASGLEARMRRFIGLWQAPHVRGHWLDAGCGAGTYTRFLIAQGQDAVGVDYVFVTLKKARERDRAAASYAVADVQRLPFRPGTFDGVLCFGVMQALADSRPALRELAAAVRPGGEFWVDALNRRCVLHAAELARRRLEGRPIHLRYESPGRVTRFLRAQGLVNVRLHWMPILPATWPRLQHWIERPIVQRLMALVPCAGLLFSHAFLIHASKPPEGGG
jgi:SAM-dependent methyltransferase